VNCGSETCSDAQREAYKITTNAEHVKKCVKKCFNNASKMLQKTASKKQAAMTV
jgi:hypothetical protein